MLFWTLQSFVLQTTQFEAKVTPRWLQGGINDWYIPTSQVN